MNSTVDEITESTMERLSLFECDTDELKQLVNQYPFFAPAKFLLAKKMKESNSFLFEEQIQKASIYFQNPVWFDHILNEQGDDQQSEAPQIAQAAFTPTMEMDVPVIHEESAASEEVVDQKSETVPDEQAKLATSTTMEIPATYEEVVDQTHKEAVDQTNRLQEDPEIEDQPDPANQPELTIELPKFKFEPIDPSKAELSFEPYHTIDYFASQGIKVREEEEKPKDRLSRQLRSFTEWIKTMKRLPESEMGAGVSITDEKKVEKMAEVSIHDREVVTEVMAEVWEKQGNVAKAIEIYQKLSLLNPGKSSYFAAKIEQLKNL